MSPGYRFDIRSKVKVIGSLSAKNISNDKVAGISLHYVDWLASSWHCEMTVFVECYELVTVHLCGFIKFLFQLEWSDWWFVNFKNIQRKTQCFGCCWTLTNITCHSVTFVILGFLQTLLWICLKLNNDIVLCACGKSSSSRIVKLQCQFLAVYFRPEVRESNTVYC